MTEDVNRYRFAGGKYEPVTYDLAFFKGNYQYVADCYKNWAMLLIVTKIGHRISKVLGI